MHKAYFFVEPGPVEPLGSAEYYISTVPRVRDEVTVMVRTPKGEEWQFDGTVIRIHWGFQSHSPTDEDAIQSVDIIVEERPR